MPILYKAIIVNVAYIIKGNSWKTGEGMARRKVGKRNRQIFPLIPSFILQRSSIF